MSYPILSPPLWRLLALQTVLTNSKVGDNNGDTGLHGSDSYDRPNPMGESRRRNYNGDEQHGGGFSPTDKGLQRSYNRRSAGHDPGKIIERPPFDSSDLSRIAVGEFE